MAIPADTVWQVDAGGSGTSYLNGCGFATSQKGATGTDLTLSAPTTFTTLATSGSSTTVTCSGGDTFNNTMLGNILSVNVSNTLNYRCITGYMNSTSITVDAAINLNGGGFSGRVGGAFTDVRQAGTTGSGRTPRSV